MLFSQQLFQLSSSPGRKCASPKHFLGCSAASNPAELSLLMVLIHLGHTWGGGGSSGLPLEHLLCRLQLRSGKTLAGSPGTRLPASVHRPELQGRLEEGSLMQAPSSVGQEPGETAQAVLRQSPHLWGWSACGSTPREGVRAGPGEPLVCSQQGCL